MKKKLLNSLIIFLGVMVSFAFYGFWKTEPTSPIPNPKNTKETSSDTSNNNAFINKDTKSNITPPRVPLDKNIPMEEPSKKVEPLDIPYDTPEAMEAHTQEVYDALQPDNHDESIEKANEAFEVLDEHVRQVEEQLKDHMQISSLNQNDIEVNSVNDEPYEMELPVVNE